MAAPSKPVGYECEFVDQVPEDYFCKQCKHVAREPTITSCCIEVFCKACFEAVTQDKKPCPSCESSDISNIGPHTRYQALILASTVRCLLKARGCEWTGQLRLLDAHLDLTTGDCVYVDVDCPSKCNQKIQKRHLDTHLASECPKRDQGCPHCFRRFTVEEIAQHLGACPCCPLECPNECGATFERGDFEDHIKICSLQKMMCVFSSAGCEAEFIRDQQKEHMEQNTQKHLALVAAATLRISQEQKAFEEAYRQEFEERSAEQRQAFERQLKERDAVVKTLEEQHQVFAEKLNELETQLEQKDRQLLKELVKQEDLLEKKLKEQQKSFTEQLEIRDAQMKSLENDHFSSLNVLRLAVGTPPFDLALSGYRNILSKRYNLHTPPLYTHPGGYKFMLRLCLRGQRKGEGTHISLEVRSLRSDNEHKLSFPVKYFLHLLLLNQHKDEKHRKYEITCEVPRENYEGTIGKDETFISHSTLERDADRETQYLKDDCLRIRIENIVIE